MIPASPRGPRAQLWRWAYFIAPLFCLVLLWRAFSVWFLNDDFAWLGLRFQVHDFSSFITALFQPQAEGTVRFISERLYFLILSSVFDLHALPFRICAVVTWFANLTLAASIGSRLTQSRIAGFVAAILWTVNAGAPQTLMWTSSYNQDLCALCILLAFYARLRFLESGGRRWVALEWLAYLTGFGVLEVIVMYPFIAALHALCTARKRLLGTLPLFIPSAIFLAIHFFLIPKTTAPIYRLAFDTRLPLTFLNYLKWTLAPVLIGAPRGTWHTLGMVSASVIGVALLGFTVLRLRQRDLTPLFFIGWFALLLGPILPLPLHLTDYYVTIPSLGLAWLGGWAMVSALRLRDARSGVALALAVAYLAGSWYEDRIYENWLYDRSNRLRIVVESVALALRDHPADAVLLSGVDNELFGSGFQDNPFRLIDAEKTYLVPDSEKALESRPELGGITRFVITPRKSLDLLDRGRARVLDVSTNSVHDITETYTNTLRRDPRIARRDFIDVGDPVYSGQLGDTWYTSEGGARWMPKSATVRLSGIGPSARKLHVTGFAPPAILASGPVKITFSGNGREIGGAVIKSPEGFDLSFPLPDALAGKSEIELAVTLDKVLHLPGDNRELGIVFGTFSIR